MILIDSSILMYAAGSEHPYKGPSGAFLERVAGGEIDAAMNAEVLQEVLHRYQSIGKWDDGRRVYDMARRIVPIVVPITAEIVDLARSLLDRYRSIMARDALHAASAIILEAEAIVSYDRDFDEIEGVRRTEP